MAGLACGRDDRNHDRRPGCGELSLLLPAMARLTQQKRPILCIGAPRELFAPALAQTGVDPDYVTQIHSASSSSKHFKENLWSAEQALRTGLPGMVVLWTPAHSILTPEILRRLHLASLAAQAMRLLRRRPCTDSLPWRLIHVAALTGLVALWLCGG